MRLKYFLVERQDFGITFHPLNEAEDIAEWEQKAEMMLSASSPKNGWGVSVFFSERVDSKTGHWVLDKAILMAYSNFQGRATNEQIDTFFHSNWLVLAFNSYERYQSIGTGCWVFRDGILGGNSFGQSGGVYVPIEEFLQRFPLEAEALWLAQNYHPETELVALIHQPEKDEFRVYGTTLQDLPGPKLVWESHKDDPLFTH